MKYTSLILVVVCIIVFAFQLLSPEITDTFVLDSSKALAEPWRLFTSMFLHGSLDHLVFNMFALGLFGFILENVIKTKRFLILFFAGGLFSSLASVFFYSASLGASGAIFAVIGTLAVLRARMVVWAFGIPMPMFVAAITWGISDMVGIFYPSAIGNIAHLAGLAFGLMFALFIRERYGSRKKDEKILKEDEMEEWEDNYMRK